jgi:hypothetical protein
MYQREISHGDQIFIDIKSGNPIDVRSKSQSARGFGRILGGSFSDGINIVGIAVANFGGPTYHGNLVGEHVGHGLEGNIVGVKGAAVVIQVKMFDTDQFIVFDPSF